VLGSGYQAVVRRFSTPAGEVVVKSPHPGALLGRVGRIAIRREHAVYERLAGIPGTPRAFGLAGGEHLVLEHVAGRSLREREQSLADREGFYARLLGTVHAMHAAGVSHCDLKRKDNVIVGMNDIPYIVDFGIARLGGRSWLGKRLFELGRQMDLNAWIKLKHGRRPEALPPEDAALYRPLWVERVARWIRIPWQKLTLRRPRQRWRRRRRERDSR